MLQLHIFKNKKTIHYNIKCQKQIDILTGLVDFWATVAIGFCNFFGCLS